MRRYPNRAGASPITKAGTPKPGKIKRLYAIIDALQRHRFGARSEQLDSDQPSRRSPLRSGACRPGSPDCVQPLPDDGRIEINNRHRRALDLLTGLNRENALFAISDDGGDPWAVIARMIETAKLNYIDPQILLAGTLNRLAAGHISAAPRSPHAVVLCDHRA